MKKSTKKTNSKVTKKPNGGQKVGQVLGNYAATVADTTLSTFGLSNVIPDSAYQGNTAQDFRNVSDVTGAFTKSILPMAANYVVPGSGKFVSMGQQMIGQFNPDDPNQTAQDQKLQKYGQMAGQVGNMAGQIAGFPYGGQLGALETSQPNDSGTTQLEKQETFQTPNGQVGQVDAGTHAQGGINLNLPNQTRVWSDRLKASTGKTFAEESAKLNVAKWQKIASDPKSDSFSRNAAKRMLEVTDKKLDSLFNEQETYKQEHGLNDDGSKAQMPDGGVVVDDLMQNGGIHIKPSHKGRFTEYKKRTGKTTEEALHSSNPHVRQMANFAKNASHWNHKPEGGVVDPNQQPLTNINQQTGTPMIQMHNASGMLFNPDGTPMMRINYTLDAQGNPVAPQRVPINQNTSQIPQHGFGGSTGDTIPPEVKEMYVRFKAQGRTTEAQAMELKYPELKNLDSQSTQEPFFHTEKDAQGNYIGMQHGQWNTTPATGPGTPDQSQQSSQTFEPNPKNEIKATTPLKSAKYNGKEAPAMKGNTFSEAYKSAKKSVGEGNYFSWTSPKTGKTVVYQVTPTHQAQPLVDNRQMMGKFSGVQNTDQPQMPAGGVVQKDYRTGYIPPVLDDKQRLDQARFKQQYNNNPYWYDNQATYNTNQIPNIPQAGLSREQVIQAQIEAQAPIDLRTGLPISQIPDRSKPYGGQIKKMTIGGFNNPYGQNTQENYGQFDPNAVFNNPNFVPSQQGLNSQYPAQPTDFMTSVNNMTDQQRFANSTSYAPSQDKIGPGTQSYIPSGADPKNLQVHLNPETQLPQGQNPAPMNKYGFIDQAKARLQNANPAFIAGSAGNFLGSAYDIYRGAKGGAPVNYDRAPANLVDYSQSRDMTNYGLNTSFRDTRKAIQQGTAGNAGNYLSNVGNAAANRDAAITDNYTRSIESEQNANAQIRNQSGQFNSRVQMQEAMDRQKEDDIASNTLRNGLTNFGSQMGQTAKDQQMRGMTPMILAAIGTGDYDFVQNPQNGKWGIKSKITGNIQYYQ